MVRSRLHVAMLPWFATGHITPYLQLSNRLAARGHQVSFFIPTNTQKKFNHLNLHPHLFRFLPLIVAQVDGLSAGVETMSDVSVDKFYSLVKAFELTQHQVDSALFDLKPDIIFFDFAYCVQPLAKELGIKPVFFWPSSAIGLSRFIPEELVEPPEYYPGSSSVNPLPYEVKHRKLSQVQHRGMMPLREKIYKSIADSAALCLRACRELDSPFLDYLHKHYNKPVMAVGPLLSQRHPSSAESESERWVAWLEGFEEGSVVYCALGSECVLNKNQFQELILGLEMTGFPFLARLKPPAGAETVKEAFPEGFEDRVRGRGVVDGDWVQQDRILAQPSVGCFVSHCGFGSMWESLGSHAQLVLLPQAADQFTNTKLMSKGLKVGVEVEGRREEDGWFSKEEVCRAVKSVMDDGGSKVGEEVRKNHRKWNTLLWSEGFESSYIDNCIKDLITMVS